MVPDEPKLFFIHVMKTGGTTFRMTLREHFGGDHLYPSAEDGDPSAYLSVSRLLDLPAERIARVRAFVGHYPYVATDLLGLDLVRVTILRDPVERTISYLKHAQRYTPRLQGRTFAEIYDDGFAFPFWIDNHQTKVFSMTPDDPLESIMQPIAIDDRRLEGAMANLAKVDIVGFQDRYEHFVQQVTERFGLPLVDVPDERVSPEVSVPQALMDRIAEDTVYDRALYDWALQVSDRGDSPSSDPPPIRTSPPPSPAAPAGPDRGGGR